MIKVNLKTMPSKTKKIIYLHQKIKTIKRTVWREQQTLWIIQKEIQWKDDINVIYNIINVKIHYA